MLNVKKFLAIACALVCATGFTGCAIPVDQPADQPIVGLSTDCASCAAADASNSDTSNGTDATASADACTPKCGTHDCGSDGCGGSCGTCTGNQICDTGVCSVPQVDPNKVAHVCDGVTCQLTSRHCDAGVATQYFFTGMCFGTGAGQYCEYDSNQPSQPYSCSDNDPSTTDSCTGDWNTFKCTNTPNTAPQSCTQNSCPAGQVCNSLTGACNALNGVFACSDPSLCDGSPTYYCSAKGVQKQAMLKGMCQWQNGIQIGCAPTTDPTVSADFLCDDANAATLDQCTGTTTPTTDTSKITCSHTGTPAQSGGQYKVCVQADDQIVSVNGEFVYGGIWSLDGDSLNMTQVGVSNKWCSKVNSSANGAGFYIKWAAGDFSPGYIGSSCTSATKKVGTNHAFQVLTTGPNNVTTVDYIVPNQYTISNGTLPAGTGKTAMFGTLTCDAYRILDRFF